VANCRHVAKPAVQVIGFDLDPMLTVWSTSWIVPKVIGDRA